MSWRRLNSKKKRKELTGGKAVSSHCQNHGSCPYCAGNRQFSKKQVCQKAEDEIKRDSDLFDLDDPYANYFWEEGIL